MTSRASSGPASTSPAPSGPAPPGPASPWWRDAVVYQVYIRSFADGNGDGIGDIPGIRSRLPYLRDLGVDAIWITPWYPSPMADGGYDVADFRAIAPEFGTLEDAEGLIADAHALGLRVLADIVPNHTSDRHPWFTSGLRDRYIFRPGRGPDGSLPPNDWASVFGGPAWTRVSDGSWYLHLFAPEQPDLDWSNPAVRAEFEDILRFWFDRGLDGFRIDVANGLVKHPELPDIGISEEEQRSGVEVPDHPFWSRDGVHEIYREWRRVADSYASSSAGPRIFVAEAWDVASLPAFVSPGELHTAFNFDFLQSPWSAAELRTTISDSIAILGTVGAPVTWVLSNHDVIRHLTRFGRAAEDLMAPADTAPVDLTLGRRRARAAILLMLALPGGAFLYQGEELGLPEVEDLPVGSLQDPVWTRSGHTRRGRDGCRVPLPWKGRWDRSWLPQPVAWEKLSASNQEDDADSMLSLYRNALRLRASSALGDRPFAWVPSAPGNNAVLAFDRGDLRCVVNFGPAPVPVPIGCSVELASGPLDDDGAVPQDMAVWLRRTT